MYIIHRAEASYARLRKFYSSALAKPVIFQPAAAAAAGNHETKHGRCIVFISVSAYDVPLRRNLGRGTDIYFFANSKLRNTNQVLFNYYSVPTR